MGLLNKLFGGRSRAAAASQFNETEGSSDGPNSTSAPRRELVLVVLRETMRKHGIPSDWIDSRILSVTTRQNKSGMHVQFIILKGEQQLLTYVHAFQDSFWRELEKFEPKPREWLFSVGWQFHGKSTQDIDQMPRFAGWEDDTLPPDTAPPHGVQDVQDTQPPDDHAEQLESDLAQLMAIRDAALSRPADLVDLPPARPKLPPPG